MMNPRVWLSFGALVTLIVTAWPQPALLTAFLRDAQGFVDLHGADRTVLLLAQCAFVLLAAWLALLIWAAERLRRNTAGPCARLVSARLTPQRIRPLLAAVVGVGLVSLAGCATPSPAGSLPPAAESIVQSVTATPTPSHSMPGPSAGGSTTPGHAADPTSSAPATPSDGPAETAQVPGSFDWPAGAPAPEPPPPTTDPGSPGYLVVSGDCLWHIAQERLPGAGTAELAEAVHELWLANRATIGADPDVLIPGQVLTLPATLSGSTS